VIDRLTIRVNFDFDKSSIRKADISELEKAVEFVKKYPDSKVVVAGHTDGRGTEKYNMKLSQRRADAVKKYLVDKGNKTDRITAEGKGEAEPIADNKTEKGRFENRRVEVLIVE
jgi:OOP family OmpA-OmpF porin